MIDKFNSAALFIVMLLIAVWLFCRRRHRIKVDGLDWSVSSRYKNSEQAAQMLSRVHNKVLGLLKHLRVKYAVGIPGGKSAAKTDDVQKIVDTLLRNYNPEAFYENDPVFSTGTSYTVAKGDSMYVCLRDRENPDNLVDEDVLEFVLLHEISHIANYNSWNHEDRFWSVFKFILTEAVEAGVYKPVDYSRPGKGVRYCGLDVNYNPYFNKNIPLLA